VDNTQEYVRVFKEVSQGFSEKTVNGKTYYFKHPTQVEYFSIFDRYNHILKEAQYRGLMTESQKVEMAIKEGWWTQAKEDRIDTLRKTITNLTKTKSKLIYPSQKESIAQQIKANENIIITYLKERHEIVGYTAEEYSNKKFYDENIIKLTYKNRDLTSKVFDDESEYYYLSDEDVEGIREAYNEIAVVLSQQNLKFCSATGFFQNLLFVSDTNPISFWGNPAVQCSKYQIDILIYGKMIKNVIKNSAESGKPLDEDIMQDPKKLVTILEDGNPNVTQQISSSEEKSNKVMSYVGATQEDLKKMGVKIEKIGGKSLLQLAEENGGVLEKDQYLNVRESL
jgi:hypothetical protein